MTQDIELSIRRKAMIEAGLWRDKTLLDHFRHDVGALATRRR